MPPLSGGSTFSFVFSASDKKAKTKQNRPVVCLHTVTHHQSATEARKGPERSGKVRSIQTIFPRKNNGVTSSKASGAALAVIASTSKRTTSLTGSYKERRSAFTPVLICLRAHPVWGEEEAVGRALALTPTSSQRSQRGRWCTQQWTPQPRVSPRILRLQRSQSFILTGKRSPPLFLLHLARPTTVISKQAVAA